ncbi:DnaB-like helicase N-terminal domain-containing protein [Candidatus Liberibacter americanus]|uniref:DNA helicase DnaB-like N-terminal domain-containing protein n=1 Tax=Candidatus Liberibacter americanus str. Sao Paulo TaxID=1261131 RepID=U6B4M6_9HYPH|nr:DnaB-like helicase N-terminal domain-containing protein [Candidatus Liberibacter americanus]AHA27845.1 hypothetical protein lam_486 [Candidatus Liberibacter americanus str. Sao Paulo]
MKKIEKDFFIEFEQEILGYMLFGGDLKQISIFLKEKHFIDPIHQEMFKAILLAHDRFGKINPLIVKRIMSSDVVDSFESKTNISLSTYLANLLANTSSISTHGVNSARRVIN